MASRPVLLAAAALAALLCVPPPARAHDPGLSVLALGLRADGLGVHLVLARREVELLVTLDADHDGAVGPAELAAARPRLEALAAEAIVLMVAGQVLPRERVVVDLDDSDAVHVRLTYERPASGRVVARVPLIGRLAVGHRQYASARDERGALVAERVLDAERAVLELDLGASPREAGSGPFWRFLRLGVEHIATGYDHLLFLLALLVAGGTFWQTVRLISSFTAAHSITLALATLDLVRLPLAVVEPLIAASIVYVGAENLLGRAGGRRWLLTFGFGLVHGLGFASALRELGLGAQTGVVVPLVAFNLGVELGQVAVAVGVLPLLWLGERRPRVIPRLAASCSGLVVLAGTYWLLERTLLR